MVCWDIKLLVRLSFVPTEGTEGGDGSLESGRIASVTLRVEGFLARIWKRLVGYHATPWDAEFEIIGATMVAWESRITASATLRVIQRWVPRHAFEKVELE